MLSALYSWTNSAPTPTFKKHWGGSYGGSYGGGYGGGYDGGYGGGYGGHGVTVITVKKVGKL